MSKDFFWIIGLVLVFTCSIVRPVYGQLSLEFIENQPKQNIYLHSITIGQGVDTSLVNTQKIFLALNFITSNLTSKYSIIPEKEVKDVIGNERDVSALHIGARLGADYVFIIKMEQLWNAVRIEIISARPKGVSDNIHTSDGVSMLSIFDKSTELPIMDPAILKSMQRAFACAVNDSAMFMHLPTPYNVKPAPGLVICGIEFLDNEELQHWSLFDNPILSSYEFIEMIYETIRNTTDWAVYDIVSRDAIYSMFNLILVENHLLPSYNELAALQQFGIDHFLTGSIARKNSGVELTLSLHKNVFSFHSSDLQTTENNTLLIKSVKKEIIQDDLPIIKSAIQKLALELVE